MPQFNIDELLNLTVAGSDDAFAEILKLYHPLVISLVNKYSGPAGLGTDDYDDLFQEAVFALYKSAISYRADKEGVTFGLYAEICISRRLISSLRKFCSHKNNQVCSIDDVESLLVSQENDPSLSLVDKERIEKLDKILENCLSDYERKIFKSYINGMDASDISKIVGKNEKSVYNAVCRIKAKVRKLL